MSMAAASGAAYGSDHVGNFEQLFSEHHQFVYRVCLAKLGDARDAEDAVQEVFLRVSRHEEQLAESPRPWLVQVAKTVCIDEYRRRGRRSAALQTSLRQDRAEPEVPEREVMSKALLSEEPSCMTEAERKVVTQQWMLVPSYSLIC